MTFATLQDAQRECNNHAGEFPGWYAAVFEQATDHRFFFMWASTPIELLKAQARHNAYIVSMHAPYDWSIELETLFTLMGSDEVADRTNALFILSAWDMKLLPADIRAAILYLARNDKHQIVRQWAEFVLDPLSKPIPPQCGE